MPDVLVVGRVIGSSLGETLTVIDHSGGDWTALAERLDGMGEVRWSVCVRDGDGQVVFAHRPDDVLSTASVGKLFLLVEVARQLDEGLLPADVPLQRTDELSVGDSGLWQYLQVEALAPEDLAVLVAAVSDNLATNVLLHRVGLDAVHRATADLGIARSALHDRVRDQRTPATAERLSSGTAFELSGLFAELGRRTPRRFGSEVASRLALGECGPFDGGVSLRARSTESRRA